jgi:hypothetical protein
MITGQPPPKWMSWTNKSKHLSGRFHSSTEGFDNVLKWLMLQPYCTEDMVAYPQSRVIVVCLGIGLILRDLQVIQFGFGEDNEDSPALPVDHAIAHLKRSRLEWEHANVLLRTCKTITANLKNCLENNERGKAGSSGSKGKRPASTRQKKAPER